MSEWAWQLPEGNRNAQCMEQLPKNSNEIFNSDSSKIWWDSLDLCWQPRTNSASSEQSTCCNIPVKIVPTMDTSKKKPYQTKHTEYCNPFCVPVSRLHLFLFRWQAILVTSQCQPRACAVLRTFTEKNSTHRGPLFREFQLILFKANLQYWWSSAYLQPNHYFRRHYINCNTIH